MSVPPHIAFPLRNIAAKWIRLGLQLFSVRALMHEAMPGILIQPVQMDSESPPLNVIVLDDSTDILITFETLEAAQALCNAVTLAVSHGPARPSGTFGLTGGFDAHAEGVIRAIERATVAARVAGQMAFNSRVQEEATAAENEAVRIVLEAFQSLPKRPFK